MLCLYVLYNVTFGLDLPFFVKDLHEFSFFPNFLKSFYNIRRNAEKIFQMGQATLAELEQISKN